MILAVCSFLFFTILVLFVSWFKTRKDNVADSDGYFLAGRSLTWPVIAGSLMLTNLSTEQLVGMNGSAYAGGASVAAWELVPVVAMTFMALFFLPRFLKSGITTVPEYLEKRYSPLVRTIVSVIFLTAFSLAFLPFVIYSGALAMNGLFRIPETFGIGTQAGEWMMVIALSVIGGVYAIFGGLKAIAVSDTINGAGLLIGGFLIPVLGLIKLGDGNMLKALAIITTQNPERLNPIGGPTDAVPFSTLFTGMFFVNVYYWCTNQVIVQRTFGAKNLAEGQKGVLFAALLKLLGLGILVFPGIIAYHLFGDSLTNKDMAYPMLVSAVLPIWLTGFFGAVMFGAILSSFNSALHSTSTLFSVDIYKRVINPKAGDQAVVKSGKYLGALLVIVCIFTAPMIAQAPEGLFNLMKKLGTFVSIPIMSVVSVGMIMRRAPPLSAYVALPLGILFYAYFAFYKEGVLWEGCQLHWLHIAGLNLVVLTLVMGLIRFIKPLPEARDVQALPKPDYDMTPWSKAFVAGVGLCLIMFFIYVYFGRFGR